MKLSIIIPVYNEEKTIKQAIDNLLAVKLPCQNEIIIIDDGSTDKTNEKISKCLEVKKLGNKIKYIHHKQNQGKGAAIRSGIKEASGDYILTQDADLEYNPGEIPKLLAPILEHTVKQTLESSQLAVYGSRFTNNQAIIPLLYYLGNKFLTLLTNLLYGSKLTDMETGYKLIPAIFIKKIHLQSDSFDMEPEITAKLILSHYKIIEVPISYRGRTHLAGKKLTLKDAFGAIKTLFYFKSVRLEKFK